MARSRLPEWLVEELEVRAHHRLPGLFPGGLLEDDLNDQTPHLQRLSDLN